MTGAERVLAELRGGPKTAAELYARTYTVSHSRISELRSKGYVIELTRTGGRGAASYLYTLLSEPAPAPVGADGVPSGPVQLSLVSRGAYEDAA